LNRFMLALFPKVQLLKRKKKSLDSHEEHYLSNVSLACLINHFKEQNKTGAYFLINHLSKYFIAP